MMSDTCGLTSCEPFAKWDHDSRSWKTSEATSLWALTLSSLTLPQWGGLHDGELCEHPTPERLTRGLDCSSLPTPRTSDSNGAGAHGSGVPDSLPAISALLPTPAVNDMGEGKTLEWWDDWAPRQKAADGRPAPHGRSLAIEAQRLLPTPTSRAAKHGETPDATANGFGSNLWDLPSLLPTPTSRDHKGANQRGDATCLHGAITALPSPDGGAFLEDLHQPQLSLDGLAHPA